MPNEEIQSRMVGPDGKCINWCAAEPRTLYRARRKHRLTEKDIDCLRRGCDDDGLYMHAPPDIPEFEGKDLVVVDGDWTILDFEQFPHPPEPTTEEEKNRRWVGQQIGEGVENFRWIQIEANLSAKYMHEQITPDTTWTIDHNLDIEQPRYILFNTEGVEIVGTVDWASSTANVLIVCFALAVAGRAYVIGD